MHSTYLLFLVDFIKGQKSQNFNWDTTAVCILPSIMYLSNWLQLQSNHHTINCTYEVVNNNKVTGVNFKANSFMWHISVNSTDHQNRKVHFPLSWFKWYQNRKWHLWLSSNCRWWTFNKYDFQCKCLFLINKIYKNAFALFTQIWKACWCSLVIKVYQIEWLLISCSIIFKPYLYSAI